MASIRFQSVPPRVRASPRFTVTRAISVLLMSFRLPGTNDTANIFATQSDNHEQHSIVRNANDRYSLLAVLISFEMSSSRFGSSRARMASQKSTPCFRRFASRLLLSYSYCTFRILPDTSSFANGRRWEGLGELGPIAVGRKMVLRRDFGRGPSANARDWLDEPWETIISRVLGPAGPNRLTTCHQLANGGSTHSAEREGTIPS
jgi:hypothetical protein